MSRKLRLSAALAALILWIPTAFGLSYGGMLWGAIRGSPDAAPTRIAAIAERPAPTPEPEAAPTDPAANPATPPRDLSLIDTTTLGPGRTVTLVRTLPFAAFLAPGEGAPHPAYRDLYAEARAGALAQAECPHLIASLARSCLPLSVRAEPLGNGDYRVTLTLAFAPADRVRALSDSEAFARADEMTELDVPAARGVPVDDLGRAHEHLYRSARFACFIARASGKACTLAEMRIETAASADTPGTFDVTGRIRLATSRPADAS